MAVRVSLPLRTGRLLTRGSLREPVNSFQRRSSSAIRSTTLPCRCGGSDLVMQNPKTTSPRSPLLLLLFAVGFAIMIFARGAWLFGSSIGVVYAIVALFTAGLFGQALLNSADSGSQVVSRGVFLIFVSFVLTFPSIVNPQVQHFIDLQATDRRIRAELSKAIDADPAFRHVVIETQKRKCVCVEISGSVSSHDDYDRLRSQVSSKCPTIANVLIDWDVAISSPVPGD